MIFISVQNDGLSSAVSKWVIPCVSASIETEIEIDHTFCDWSFQNSLWLYGYQLIFGDLKWSLEELQFLALFVWRKVLEFLLGLNIFNLALVFLSYQWNWSLFFDSTRLFSTQFWSFSNTTEHNCGVVITTYSTVLDIGKLVLVFISHLWRSFLDKCRFSWLKPFKVNVKYLFIGI